MGFDISIPGPRLGLGLGLHDHSSENCMKSDYELRQRQSQKKKEADPCNKAYPSLTLAPPDDEANNNIQQITKTESDEYYYFHPHASSPSAHQERERSVRGEELELEVEKIPSRVVDVDENGYPKKKLRLTKEQSAVLEDSFKEHATLSPKQKQELSKKLNLRARQVEVWFQNRRARTKLKQTEVDCELLKKCCETLTEENKMLQKELQELKSMKTTLGPFYMQLPVASLTICPSCERICGGSGASNNGSSPATALLVGPKAHQHFYKNNYTFTQPSAAC
ncbi:Homeobox-leucine zipper protein HOX19 [Spatholobus suberectus]|nr:Homeobox-leucine zipper protein HOX19 [Spatholobus suberectus]